MSPEYLYYLMVIGLAGTAAPFSRIAAVVLGVWVFGQIAWAAGVPMPWTYVALHGVAFIIGCKVSRNPFCALVTALFVPILAVDLAEIWGLATPAQAWWLRVYLGVVQLTFVWPAAIFGPLRVIYRKHIKKGSTTVERAIA